MLDIGAWSRLWEIWAGEWLDIDINRRVIGVAGSSRKGPAILGALRGLYANVLITDDQAARSVLALNEVTASDQDILFS